MPSLTLHNTLVVCPVTDNIHWFSGSGKLSRKGAPRPEASIPNVPVSVCGAADMNGCCT